MMPAIIQASCSFAVNSSAGKAGRYMRICMYAYRLRSSFVCSLTFIWFVCLDFFGVLLREPRYPVAAGAVSDCRRPFASRAIRGCYNAILSYRCVNAGMNAYTHTRPRPLFHLIAQSGLRMMKIPKLPRRSSSVAHIISCDST